MPKQSGLAWTTFSVEESDGSTSRDIRNDITNFQMATPRGVQDTTGIDKSAHERLLLLADISYTLTMVYNPTAAFGHQVFRTVSSTSVQRTTVCGIGGESLTSQILWTDYALTRAADGSFTSNVPGVLADGTVPTWVTA